MTIRIEDSVFGGNDVQTRFEQIIETVFGAIFIAVCIVFSPLLRLWYNRWGATSQEPARPLPGDERSSPAASGMALDRTDRARARRSVQLRYA
jgi:hypothetical protein